MTEKAQQETDKTATGSDNTWEVIDRLEKDARDFFLGDPPPTPPSPDEKPATEKSPEHQPGRGHWWDRLWSWLKDRFLLNLFFLLLLILSWMLSTVGFYVLFSTWSIETPFELDALIGQIRIQWGKAESWDQLIGFWGPWVLAMFFAALGAVLIGTMSRYVVRLWGRLIAFPLSVLLLLLGFFISGMSGFVVMWSYNNHEALLQDYRKGIRHRLDVAIKRVEDYYAPKFAKEKREIREGQQKQKRINSLSGRREKFRQEIDKYKDEFDRFSRLFRGIEGNTRRQLWIQRQVERVYKDSRDPIVKPMISHLLGENGVEPGFGRKTTEFAGAIAKDWARRLHKLCKDLSSATGDLARALGTDDLTSEPCVPTEKDLEAEFDAKSLFRNGKPNYAWLTGAFIEGLEDKFIGPLLDDVKGRSLGFSILAGEGKPSGAGSSSDRLQWATDFDDTFRSRIKSIREEHTKKDSPDFIAAFEKLEKLSTDLNDQLSKKEKTAYPVDTPEPQRLHTVVRERFLATWFVNTYHVPERYLNEKRLITIQPPSTELFRTIEAVNKMTHFSREGFVTALEDSLQMGLSPYLRVQLLGVADCGHDDECGRRIAALKKDHEPLARNLENLGLEYLFNTSADLDDRERDLLQGVIRERTATVTDEYFAQLLASLSDILAIALGIFAVVSARERRQSWVNRPIAWLLAHIPRTQANYQSQKKRVQRQARREWEKQERELWKRWENIRRTSREHFIGRCNDFDLEKQKRWKVRLKTDDGGIETRIDAAIEQDLVLMATGIPGAEMNSLAKVATKLSEVYRGIAEDSGKMYEAFRDGTETIHKTLAEIENVRDVYRDHKEEMKLMFSELREARNQAELAAIHARISALKQSGKEAQEKVRRYVDQSLDNFRSLLTNIEHFDQTDFFQKLSEKERGAYSAFAASLEKSAREISYLLDEYQEARASGSFDDQYEGKGQNGNRNDHV